MEWPKCQKCNNGALIPLSDYGQEGASVMFKAWVCTNPDCGFSLRVDKGEVTYGRRIETKHKLISKSCTKGQSARAAFFYRSLARVKHPATAVVFREWSICFQIAARDFHWPRSRRSRACSPDA
jgi:hypothetical protein